MIQFKIKYIIINRTQQIYIPRKRLESSVKNAFKYPIQFDMKKYELSWI